MAKRRHEDVTTESSKATLAIMALGAVIVAGLVVWALTRTVQPAPAPSVATQVPMGAEQTASTVSNPALPPLDNTAPSGTPAQTSTYTPRPPSEDENASVPRIALQDLKAAVDTKAVTVIDVRQDTAYMTAHIPGSLHVPMTLIESQLSTIPKDKPIVTYCT